MALVLALAAGAAGQVPTIVTPPASQEVLQGYTASLAVAAESPSAVAYQWLWDGTNVLAGATNASLALTNAQLSQSGTYAVVITNVYGAVTSPAATLTVLPLPRSPVVDHCSEAALLGALAAGGPVTFTCDGTITLASQIVITNDTVLDGTGHAIALTGQNRAFYVHSNVTFTLINLSITNSTPPPDPPFPEPGGGILNDGGIVNLQAVSFLGNFSANGGALWNTSAGTVNATNCSFIGNAASGWLARPYEISRGGAIGNFAGLVNLDHCWFSNNSAQGYLINNSIFGSQEAYGGAIENEGALIVNACTFQSNSASGGQGTVVSDGPDGIYVPGGPGGGGAIFNFGSLRVANSTFQDNRAAGDDGGGGGFGLGGAVVNNGRLSLVGSTFLGNSASGGNGLDGTEGGSGLGGAVYNQGTLTVERSYFTSNQVSGANGGNGPAGPVLFGPGSPDGSPGGSGGSAEGGAIWSSATLSLCSSTFASNACFAGAGGRGGDGGEVTAIDGYGGGGGGPGGDGGSGNGGALCNRGSASLVNDTFVENVAVGAVGGGGGLGRSSYYHGVSYPAAPNGAKGSAGGAFGAIYSINGQLYLTNCTIASNSVSGAGASAISGGSLVNTLLAGNSPQNGYPNLVDLGHNLSSDRSCAFRNVGSLNNTDPVLGPLADNGGPTLTMALLAGSPAIGAADSASAPPADQRGFPRPSGSADIGAYDSAPRRSSKRPNHRKAVWTSP